jgi:titin
VIAGNFIGVDPTGTFAQSNMDNGIAINSGHHNLIGGDLPDERNLISGNISGETIRLNGSQTLSNTVSGNYLGTDVSGTFIIGNNGSGVAIHSGAQYNLVGGDSPEERNIISGNGNGVALWDADTRYNIVSGNFIGTDVSGTIALGNRSVGVGLWSASYNTIGGDAEGERNVISGNNDQGVGMWNSDTSNNVIQGNFIGTDASGTVAMPNLYSGVHLNGPHHNQVIGNLISANGYSGVELCCTPETSYNTVIGNFIGTDVSGQFALGNSSEGVVVSAGAHDNVIGGVNPGESELLFPGNLISGNGSNGISLWDGGTNNNTIAGNLIGTDASGTRPLANGWRSSETLKETLRNEN